MALAVGVLAIGLAGGPAWGQPVTDVPSDTRAMNERAMQVLNQIRRAYPVDFGEEPAIHKAVRAHLARGGDPADVRLLVKAAVIRGCRAACMRALFQGFIRLREAGIPGPEIRSLLTDAMKEARKAMPRRYTYEMLAEKIAARVDRRLDATPPTGP